ncbi:tetratricopeptide repeat protein [Candidatus Margulisiibacteriota bacterium]
MATKAEFLKKDLRKKPRDPMILRNLGRVLLIEKKYKDARSRYRLALLYNPRLLTEILLDFEEVLHDRPDDISVRLILADLCLYIGEIDSAIGELEEILEIDSKRADVYSILGKLYLKKQDFDRAIKLLEQAMGSNIKDINITEMLAGTYVEKGRIPDAISLYKNLIEVNPDNKNYSRILGELYERMSEFEEAARNYMAMLNESPDLIQEVIYKLEELVKKASENIFVRETLADAYIRGIKPDLAVLQCKKILEIDASKIDLAIKKYHEILYRYPDEADTLTALGEALIQKGEFTSATEKFHSLIKYNDEHLDDAIAGYQKILEKYDKHSLAHEFLGDAYIRKEQAEEALEEYLMTIKLDKTSGDSIVPKCQELIRSNPNMILAHHVLGEAYISCGEYRRAIEEAEFMIYLNKNYSSAYVVLGDGYIGLKDALKAIESYTLAIRLDPYNTAIHEKNRSAHLISFDEEIAVLKKKIEENPWKLGLHLDLAKVYILKRDFNEGIKHLQVAAKDSTRAPFTCNTLGLAFMEEGRFDLAVAQFEKSIEVTPKELGDFSKIVRFNLGSALEAAGNVERAISEYEKVLQEDVGFGALQGRIKVLSNCGPVSLRNKAIAVVISELGQNKTLGMWGVDFRTREVTREALNISFGQDHNNFGFDHFIKGRFRAAEEAFELAMQLDSDFYAALNNLAAMYFRSGKLEAAETRLNLALSIDPSFAVVYNNIGVLDYLNGKYKDAAQNLQKALEINPNLSSAYINLGDVLYLQDKCEQALSLWKKIRDFDPLSPIARRRLAFRIVEQ